MSASNNDPGFWSIYGNALSVWDPSGASIGSLASTPSIFSSNATVTIPTLASSNVSVQGNVTIGNNGLVNLLAGSSLNLAGGSASIGGALSTTSGNNITSGYDLNVSRRARVNTNWDSGNGLVIDHPGSYLNAAHQSNGITVFDSRSNGWQLMSLGSDSVNRTSYIQGSTNGGATPIALQPLGGGVGIGTIPAAGYALDVNGSVNIRGGILTTTNNAFNPKVRLNFASTVFAIVANNVYPIGDPGNTNSIGDVAPVGVGGFVFNPPNDASPLLNARLTLRVGTNAPNTNNGAPMTASFYVVYAMFPSNSPSRTWSIFTDANTGNSTTVTVTLRSVDHGASVAQSNWFVFPAALVNTTTPLYMGLLPIDGPFFRAGYQARYLGSYLDVY